MTGVAVSGRSAPVSLLLSALWLLCAAGAGADETAVAPAETVEMRIDTVLASNSGQAFDPALISLQQPFRGLFAYSSYRLVQGERRLVSWRREERFLLPGGRYLIIIPRGLQNDRVSLNVMLIHGTRPLVNTVVSLKNNGTFMVAGPQYADGMLIIAIGANVSPSAPAAAPVPAAAEVQSAADTR